MESHSYLGSWNPDVANPILNPFPEFLYVEECLNQIVGDRPKFIVEAAQLGASIPAAFGLRIINVRCGSREQSRLNIVFFGN